jgi:hypothetical protein
VRIRVIIGRQHPLACRTTLEIGSVSDDICMNFLIFTFYIYLDISAFQQQWWHLATSQPLQSDTLTKMTVTVPTIKLPKCNSWSLIVNAFIAIKVITKSFMRKCKYWSHINILTNVIGVCTWMDDTSSIVDGATLMMTTVWSDWWRQWSRWLVSRIRKLSVMTSVKHEEWSAGSENSLWWRQWSMRNDQQDQKTLWKNRQLYTCKNIQEIQNENIRKKAPISIKQTQCTQH